MKPVSRFLILIVLFGSGALLNAATASCTLNSASPSVTICTPAPNATVTSPVHINAGSTDNGKTVQVMQVYVDGVKVFQESGGMLDTSLSMTPSTTQHRLTVQAYDGTTFFKSTIFITVTSGTATTVTVSPSSLNFSPQNVGTTSPPQTVQITNNNTSAAVTVSSIAASGDFAETDNCGTSIAAGASCTANVTFTPTATGTRTGTLTVTDSASNSPQTVALSGAGGTTANGITVSPSSLTFASQNVGTTSAPQTVTVTNNDSTEASITSIAASGDFAQSNTCGSSLAANSNCSVSVTFTPTASGTRSGTLTLTDSASNSPQTVSLSGTGATAPTGITVSPSSLTFASQNVGTTSAPQTVTVTNNDSSAASITSIAASGDFAQSNNCGTSLAANSNCSVSVTFTPTASGTRTGTLTLTDSASNSPQTVSLSGTGASTTSCTATGSGSPPSVTICTPANGATVTSPVHITAATADSGHTVVEMKIYVDNNPTAVYAIAANKIDTNLTLANGSHFVVAQAWDNASPQNVFKQGINITVSGTAGISVSVTPSSATVQINATQQFTATVSGTTNTSVTWSVDGVTGGNSTVGTISTSGLYTAPAAAGTHTVTATSVADTTRSGSAQVTVTTSAPIVSVTTRHYNNARTGANLNETILTPSNVNSTNFGKKFSLPVDGIVYAQPLYVPNLTIGGVKHNVIFVATENDSVYAFDADGITTTALWKKSFVNSAAGITTIPCSEVHGCGVAPNIGITATPVISTSNNTIYVEARTKENGVHVNRLHALSLTSGADKVAPVKITATVAGTGAGSVNGQVTFDSTTQNERPGLLLLNNVVYVAYASFGDATPYHGWIIGYDGGTLAQVAVFNDDPNGSDAGFWNSAGLAADSSGNIFAASGNGSFSSGNQSYGNSVMRISANGSLVFMDYFTPSNFGTLSANDIDVGSGGPLLLPTQAGTAHPDELVVCGKEGKIYLIDRSNMGKFNSTGDLNVQSIPNAVGGSTLTTDRNFATAAYWNGKVYFAGNGDVLKAFSLTSNGTLSTSPMKGSFVFAFPGGAPNVSANGSSNGIVWVIDDHTPANTGALHAYNANTLAELYNTSQNSTRDALPSVVKFTEPTVANGKVYVGTFNSVVVYGLLH